MEEEYNKKELLKEFLCKDIPRLTYECSESKKHPILSYRRLSPLEKIIFSFSRCSITSNPSNKCSYDHTKLVLYKAFVKRIPPKDSKDLNLIDWFIFGQCALCGNLYEVSDFMNTYLWN